MSVIDNLDEFVIFPSEALLLLEGVIRNGYHKYPENILQIAKAHNLKPDGRFNGPAVLAFQIAGGNRPSRYGSNNAWSIHHIYSGKFKYFNQNKTTHATKEGSTLHKAQD